MRNEWRLPVDTVKWQRGDWGLKMGENKVKFGVMILFLEALGRSCDCSDHRQDVCQAPKAGATGLRQNKATSVNRASQWRLQSTATMTAMIYPFTVMHNSSSAAVMLL